MTSTQYTQLFFDALEYIKTNIIAPNSPGSKIETRYVTSQGNDDEQWIGSMRDEETGATDIWLITLVGINGIGAGNKAIGTTDKPVSVILDFFYDYRQGVDYDEDTGETNSEREFLKKLLPVDFALEQKQGCLSNNITIRDWAFRLKLKRFKTDTTHWAQGIINLQFNEIIL